MMNSHIKIYIPLWLNIKGNSTILYRERKRIYIPLWLNIKCSATFFASIAFSYIYIPLWLNIKLLLINPHLLFFLHLHSTLIKYKEKSCNEKSSTNVRIYIPLWLNIKSGCSRWHKHRKVIYIPLWLNIKEK